MPHRWSVCYMAATQLVAEIYKFRMMTLEYEYKPPPVLEGEEPAPPLSEKEKKRLARNRFVERVKAFYACSVREMSQGAGIKRTRPAVKAARRHDYRLEQEHKPSVAQWLDIKLHAEKHHFRTNWTFPTVNFLDWMSGLQPYVHQRVLRAEMRLVIEELLGSRRLALDGRPWGRKQADVARLALEKKLELPPKVLSGNRDELQQLTTEVGIELCKEQVEAIKAEGGSAVLPAKPGRKSQLELMIQMLPQEEAFVDAADAMRKQVMELQGMKYGKLSVKERKEEKRKKKKQGEATKEVDDDYLAGSLAVESYVVFRTRPLMEHYEKEAFKLANRLVLYETIIFVVNAAGAFLAVVQFDEWVTLTVAVVAVLTNVIEFTQLRNQVVSVNLALRDLQRLIVWWDSLSDMLRRTDEAKSRVVDTTERAIIQVVDEKTTAASRTQLSVEKELQGERDEEDV